MIKLFHGEDSFESYVNAFKEAKNIADKNNLEIKVLNVDEIDRIDQFASEIEGVGMFSSESVIFAKRLFKNKAIVNFLEENFDRLNNYSIIIWHDAKVDGRLNLTKKLSKAKSVFIYNELKEWQIGDWLQKIAKAKGISLTKDQINHIAGRLGTNKWIILNELNKLKIFIDSTDDKSLTNEDIDKILGFNINGDIWAFLDYFGNLERIKMLEEFEKITKFENNTQYLIAMISRELNLIYKIKYAKENDLDLKTLGMHPFVLQKTLKKAGNFSVEKVRILFRNLLELDTNIKQGEVDEVTGMALFLTQV